MRVPRGRIRSLEIRHRNKTSKWVCAEHHVVTERSGLMWGPAAALQFHFPWLKSDFGKGTGTLGIAVRRLG